MFKFNWGKEAINGLAVIIASSNCLITDINKKGELILKEIKLSK